MEIYIQSFSSSTYPSARRQESKSAEGDGVERKSRGKLLRRINKKVSEVKRQ